MFSEYPVQIIGRISYETRAPEGKGKVASGYVSKNRAFLMTALSEDRPLEIEINGLVALPQLLAAMASEPPEDDEDQEDFMVRLETMDRLADAFEQAALMLRKAPRG